MKSLLVALGIAASAAGQITVDQGVTVNFGDPIDEVTKKLGETAYGVDAGREGIHRSVGTAAALLHFDSGRLWRVTYESGFAYNVPLLPFAEHWKNPSEIPAELATGVTALATRMPREQFNSYFAAWKQRAERAGKREGTDYWVKETKSAAGDKITITFGPRRKLVGTGELTGDMWIVSFAGAANQRYRSPTPAGALKQLVLSRDEFSTERRGTPETETPIAENPTPAGRLGPGLTLPDGTHLSFGQKKAEVAKLVGVEATEITQLGARTGIDQKITLTPVVLHFDTEQLARIEYRRFNEPLRPFAEPWKNFDAIDGLHMRYGMTPAQLNAYLEAWEKRAVAAGKQRDKHFRINEPPPGRKGPRSITMQPGRASPTGTTWSDMWTLGFSVPLQDSTAEPRLVSVMASRGDLITRPPPARVQQMKEMRDAAKNVPLPEIELPKPEILPPK